jgi:hypothetical protein
MRKIDLRRLLALALTCVFTLMQLSIVGAQATQGVVAGSARSVAGAPVGKIKIEILAAGKVTASSITADDGGFNIPNVPYGMYTVRCVSERGQTLGTASVVVTSTTPTVRVTCASEVVGAFKKKKPYALLAGLGAAAVAIGAVAVVATGSDASGSR